MFLKSKRILCVIMVVMAGLSGQACTAASTASERYRDTVKATDLSLIKTDFGKDGATALYIGSPAVDLLSNITGPGLVLSRDSRDFSFANLIYVGSGYGTSLEGNRCLVIVYRVRSGPGDIDYAGRRNLTEDQIAGLERGELALVEVGTLCDADADR
jgi:hypothetical protein